MNLGQVTTPGFSSTVMDNLNQLGQMGTEVGYQLDHATLMVNPWSPTTPEPNSTVSWEDPDQLHQGVAPGGFVANLCLRITNLETHDMMAYCTTSVTEPLVWVVVICFLTFVAGLLYGFLCARQQQHQQQNQDKLPAAAPV